MRYRGDSFVVERNGEPVARVEPVESHSVTSVAEAFSAWRTAGDPDSEFARDLEQVNSLDAPAEAAWES